MQILLLTLLLIAPLSAEATSYTLVAYTPGSGSAVFLTRTQDLTSFSAGNAYFSVSPSNTFTFSSGVSGSGSSIWTIERNGHTQLISNGVVLVDGLTSFYSLFLTQTGTLISGGFHSSFIDAYIDSRLVGGLDSHDWSGALSLPIYTDGFDQQWTLQATTTATVLPEPSSLGLLAFVSVALWLWRSLREMKVARIFEAFKSSLPVKQG